VAGPVSGSGQPVAASAPLGGWLRDRALWSVVTPVAGFVLSLVGLRLSDRFGSSSTIAGIQHGNDASAAAFLVVGAMDLVLGAVAMALALSVLRRSKAAVGGERRELAVVGVTLGAIVVLAGIVAIAIGLFLKSLNSLTF
jgi:hypothetical protein